MKIIKNETGKAIGRPSLKETLATMDPGEIWEISPEETGMSPAYVRTGAYSYAPAWNKQFHVKEQNGKIIITRIK